MGEEGMQEPFQNQSLDGAFKTDMHWDWVTQMVGTSLHVDLIIYFIILAL